MAEEYIFELTDSSALDGMKNISLFNARCTGEKIVRCKDCLYFDKACGWCERPHVFFEEDGFGVEENDYCSKGRTEDD